MMMARYLKRENMMSAQADGFRRWTRGFTFFDPFLSYKGFDFSAVRGFLGENFFRRLFDN
jgi:hypothetical protein